VLPLGQVLMALGALGEGFAGSLSLLTMCSALAGIGIGINNVGINVTASQLYPERGEAALNALNAFFGTGAFLAPLLGEASVAWLGSYTPAFVVTAALFTLPGLLLYAGLPRATSAPVDAARTRLPLLLRERWLWARGAIAFLYLGAEIGFGGWIVTVLQHADHLSPEAAAPVAALFWLCLALGGIVTGYALRRGVSSAHLVLTGAGAATVTAGALALFSGVTPLAVFAAGLMGLSFAPIFPLNVAIVGRIAGRRALGAVGGATALVLMAGQLGGGVLPFCQGLLLGLGPGATVALTCLCSALIFVVQRASASQG
jgi:fucose permease